MQRRRRHTRIVRAEINSKIEHARLPVIYRRHSRPVIVAIQTQIEAGQRKRERREGVNLVIWAVGGLLVDCDGFDDVRAGYVVGAGCADCVVAAVEGCGVVGGAGPGYVAVGADYGEELLIRVWSGVDDGVGPGGVACVAAGGLGGDKDGEGREEEGEESELHGRTEGRAFTSRER